MVDPELVQRLCDLRPAITVLVCKLARDQELADEVFSLMAVQLCDGRLSCAGMSPEATTRYLLKAASNFVKLHFRKRVRQPRTLDPDVIETVVCQMDTSLEDSERWLQALSLCLQKLSPRQIRNLLEHYGNGRAIKDLQADGDPRSVGTIYKEHGDLKRQLRECVNKRVEGEPRN